MADIFAAIDFSTVAASVIVIGVAVIGIQMAFKAIDLGKRGVKKA
jgi:type IV secretory pathway VirB2 component (pilin)